MFPPHPTAAHRPILQPISDATQASSTLRCCAKPVQESEWRGSSWIGTALTLMLFSITRMLLLPTPHRLYSTVGPQTRFAASERCSSQSALTRLCGRIPIGSGGFTLIRSFLQDTGIANPRQYRHYMPAPNALFISRRFLTLLPHSFVYLSITLP